MLQSLWQKGNGCSSFQVLFEIQAVLLKKFKDQISFQKRKEIAEDLSLWPIISPTRHLFLKAIRFQQHHHLSWWDSLVVVSAIEAKADYLVTEDLNPGQSYESVQVLNPFIL